MTLHAVDLGAMIALGFVGSGHCIGMCGPIALAVCPASRGRGAALLYNTGRVVTYTGIGAALGFIGPAISTVAPLEKVQVVMMAVAALLMAWMALSLFGWLGRPRWIEPVSGDQIPGAKGLLRRAVTGGSMRWAFPLGLVLGFLPCGMSMGAFSRALATSSAGAGALLVAAFGIGTMPAMVGVSLFGGLVPSKYRRVGEVIAGILLIAMSAQQLMRSIRMGL